MSIANVSAREAAWIADDVEARAFSDVYAAAPDESKARLGLGVQGIADATLFLASRIPSAMFNRVIGLGMRQAASLETVRAIAGAYRRARVQSWWVHWNPFARPADLPSHLLAAGYTEPRRRAWAKMLRDTTPPPAIATDLDVGPIKDGQQASVVEAIVESNEMPGFMVDWLVRLCNRPRWTLYAVAEGGRIAGGAALFLDGQDAWLGLGGVLPAYRRRGGQGRLMTLRIEDAIARGARHIVTETGEAIADEPNPSLGNMVRCGFTRVASRLNFASPSA